MADMALVPAPQPQTVFDPVVHLREPSIEVTRFPGDGTSPHPSLFCLRSDSRELAAGFRVLAQRLAVPRSPRVILVSSARRGAGRTTAAINLAAALREHSRAGVLVAEAGPPQIAERLRFCPPVCFRDQIEGHVDRPYAPWHVAAVESAGIHVAAIDPMTRRAAPIDSLAFAFAVEQLRRAGYAHIVIDGPPVLGGAEANWMSARADAVILAVRAAHCRGRDVVAASRQLGPERILGSVLLGA